MYSMEQKRAAIETYIRFDHSSADTIAELGYPSRTMLRKWWKEYERTGTVPERKPRTPAFSAGQMHAAVSYYLEHGRCLSRTRRAMGYPKSNATLAKWVDELAPGKRKVSEARISRRTVPIAEKIDAVAELESGSPDAREVAERHGVTRAVPYVWRREILGSMEGGNCQRCAVHFHRNALSKVPARRRKRVAAQPKAIHAQESLGAGLRKAEEVARELETSRPADAAKVIREGVAETLAYAGFPMGHWRRIRTNNGIERLNREVKRRANAVGGFPDGRPAMMLATARCKYVADGTWGKRRCLDISLLDHWDERGVSTEWLCHTKSCRHKGSEDICERCLTEPAVNLYPLFERQDCFQNIQEAIRESLPKSLP